MQLQARTALSRAKVRANNSVFIFIIFSAVFAESLRLELPAQPTRSQYEDLQLNFEHSNTTPSFRRVRRGSPPQVAQDAVWQPVHGTRYSFFVYSAWVERRQIGTEAAPVIRVIGATSKSAYADAVMCLLYMPDRTLRLDARVQTLPEHHNEQYSAVYVLCLLGNSSVKPQDTVGASLAVTARSDEQHDRNNLLLVMDTEPKPGIENTLYVCVKPFHHEYDRAEWVVEWIELHKLLGVSHFYMYNRSLSNRTSCVLNHYQEQGLLTMMSWNLPIPLWMEGQLAAYGDCLHRSMANAAWLMPVDVDEVVIPRSSDSLVAMLDLLTANHTGAVKPVAYLFKNFFFFGDDAEAPAALETLRNTQRAATSLYPHRDRSKYIVHPPGALEIGVHHLHEHMPGRHSFNVSEEVALLQHYRGRLPHDRIRSRVVLTTDRTIYKWADELIQKVKTKLKQMNSVCSAFNFTKLTN